MVPIHELGTSNIFEDKAPELPRQITELDHQRFVDLSQRIGTRSLNGGYRDQDTVDLRRELRSAGSTLAQFVLDQLQSLDLTQPLSRFREYQLCTWLQWCATSEEATQISRLLNQESILNDPDSSRRLLLSKILGRIGTSAEILLMLEAALQFPIDTKGDNSGHNVGEFDLFASDIYENIIRIIQRERVVHNSDIIFAKLKDLEARLSDYDVYAFSTPHSFDDLLEEPLYKENFDEYFQYSPDYNVYNDDDSLMEDLENGMCLDTQDRLDVLRNLYDLSILDSEKADSVDFDTKIERHYLRYREENPSPYLPSIGMEIEVRKSTALPKEAHTWDTQYKENFLGRRRNIEYVPTLTAGMPMGLDVFWEFAQRPSSYYLTLSKEVQQLIELSLINSDYHRHSVHITLGGISSDDPYGNEVYFLARALDATGWSTTAGRLLRPYYTKSNSWNYKGEAGVYNREEDSIQLGETRAVELRTMQLQSLTGLNRVLRSAQLLGAAFKAHQEIAAGKRDETRFQLSYIWEHFTEEIETIFAKANLDNPGPSWSAPKSNSDQNADQKDDRGFFRLAELLDQAQKSPSGGGNEGSRFVADVRLVVIRYRSEIAKILFNG